MTTVEATLARLPIEEPSWLFGMEREGEPSLTDAADFLREQDDENFGIFVLAYGFGMHLGTLSQMLRLDPAIAFWRMRRAFETWASAHPGDDPAVLEFAICQLLRGESTEPAPSASPGRRSWLARDLVEDLDAEVQQRLHDRLTTGQPPVSRSGVGVGSVVLILIAVLAFMVIGFIRDQDPFLRGKSLMEQGRFEAAREAFSYCGRRADALKETALCWLAEGAFERAYDQLADSDAGQQLGVFQPRDHELVAVEVDRDSQALLPRGLVKNRRPTFVITSGPPGMLRLYVGERDAQLAIPDTRGGPPWVELPYPEEWSGLDEGVVIWTVEREDSGISQASFTVLDKPSRQEIERNCWRWLDRRVPGNIHDYLRGHYFLNRGLTMEAAQRFAALAVEFPDAEYPLDMVTRLAGSLGVDPDLFLR